MDFFPEKNVRYSYDNNESVEFLSIGSVEMISLSSKITLAFVISAEFKIEGALSELAFKSGLV